MQRASRWSWPKTHETPQKYKMSTVSKLGSLSEHQCAKWCLFRNFLEPPTAGSFSKVSPVQMGGILRYKLEAYCSTNWRCTAEFPFQRYKWGAYCGTNWRCTASTFQTRCTGWGLLNSSHLCHVPGSLCVNSSLLS